MDDREHTAGHKILTLDQLVDRRADARRGGQRVVQCHGCFDIVHPGHIRHLRSAAAQGDRLLVSITADRFVNKGAGRPVFSEDLRADNLAALSFVDWVYVNDQETASELLTTTRPDVYVKGAEYEGNDDPRFAEERSIVETHGGRVVFSSSDVVFSSTALAERVEENDSSRARLRMLDRAYDLSPRSLERTIDKVAGKRIVVVGETIIDTYIQCTWPEISSEAPMLSLRPVEQSRFDAGCAVIAQHLASIGAEPVLITTLPQSSEADAFVERMRLAGVGVHAVRSGERIPAKDRYIVGREKKMKIDHASDLTLDTRARASLLALIEQHTLGADACIIADYGLGMFTPRSLTRVCSSVRERTPILTGDVSGRRSSLLSMRSAELLCPSEHELRFAIGDYDSSLPAVVWKTLEATSARSLAVTLNEEGVIHFSRRAVDEPVEPEQWASRLNSVHIPSFAQHPIDTLGCGDALLAITTAALTTGEDPCRSLVLGSLAASIQSSALGNAPITHEGLLAAMRRTLAPRVSNQVHRELKPLAETPSAWT